MASTSSRVWLTFAAAIGTLVIAGMVVTAPSVQRCQGQEEGLWACLRGELITFGLLPEETPEPPVVAVGQPVPDEPATPAADASSLPPAAETPAPAIAPEMSPPAEPTVAEAVPAPPPAADETASPVAVAELPHEPPVVEVEPAPAGVPDASPPPPDTAPPPVATAETVPEPSAPPPDQPAPPPPLPALQPMAVADGATGIAANATVTPAPTLPRLSAILAPVVGIRVALLAESLRLLPPASTLTPPELPAPATAAPDLTQPVDAASPASEAGPPALDAIAAAPAEPALPPPPTLTATATAAVAPGASATIAPTIDAIEIDGSSRFIAGAGTDGSTVDLYVGQRYIGSADVEGGRWVFEARGAIDGDLRVALAPEARGSASLGTAATLAFNVAPTGVRLVGKQAAAELLQVQPESELELTPAAPTLQAFVSVDPELLRFRSGKAIIRRGDTLWAIARRVYGRGALYPLIFEANRDLVRRPGRIFPGQVLTLPQAD